VQTVHELEDLKRARAALRASGEPIALVPTMGALHDGHMALVALGKKMARHVVVSIFVNPRQFGAHEDLESYPRPLAADRAKLDAQGVDLLWAPTIGAMYPAGYATTVSVSGLGTGLCGRARPGHFDGVATVVSKLFNQIRPDFAVFGEKDWQQLAIIRRLNLDLNLGVTIVGVPTVREADGLALSSRNLYLTREERTAASALPRALQQAVTRIRGGEPVNDSLTLAADDLLKAGFTAVDYIHVIDPDTLDTLEKYSGSGRIIVAAHLGRTRLIDNMPI
jgi:pantoate--beta-alanine ligase